MCQLDPSAHMWCIWFFPKLGVTFSGQRKGFFLTSAWNGAINGYKYILLYTDRCWKKSIQHVLNKKIKTQPIIVSLNLEKNLSCMWVKIEINKSKLFLERKGALAINICFYLCVDVERKSI